MTQSCEIDRILTDENALAAHSAYHRISRFKQLTINPDFCPKLHFLAGRGCTQQSASLIQQEAVLVACAIFFWVYFLRQPPFRRLWLERRSFSLPGRIGTKITSRPTAPQAQPRPLFQSPKIDLIFSSPVSSLLTLSCCDAKISNN